MSKTVCRCVVGFSLAWLLAAAVHAQERSSPQGMGPERLFQPFVGMAPGIGVSSEGGTWVRANATVGLDLRLGERVVLRPSLGIGRGRGRTLMQAGTVALYRLWPRRRLTPYFGLGAAYTHDPGPECAVTAACLDLPPAPAATGPDYLSLSSHAGVRWRLTPRLAAFAEAGLGHTFGRRLEWTGQSWREPGFFDSRARVRTMVGLSFGL